MYMYMYMRQHSTYHSHHSYQPHNQLTTPTIPTNHNQLTTPTIPTTHTINLPLPPFLPCPNVQETQHPTITYIYVSEIAFPLTIYIFSQLSMAGATIAAHYKEV